MISNPELCKLEPKHEHRFAQELSETVLIVKIFLDKPFKIIQDGNLHTFFFNFQHFNYETQMNYLNVTLCFT